MITEVQNDFMNEEIWILTFGGAFQRSGVYGDISVDDPRRTLFREDIKRYVEKIILPQYQNNVIDEDTHINNLVDFSEWSKEHSEIIKGGY